LSHEKRYADEKIQKAQDDKNSLKRLKREKKERQLLSEFEKRGI